MDILSFASDALKSVGSVIYSVATSIGSIAGIGPDVVLIGSAIVSLLLFKNKIVAIIVAGFLIWISLMKGVLIV